MAKNSITDYSKTASLNTDIQSVDIDEGCLPSGINNAIRELMADLAAMNDGTVTLTSPSFAAASLTGNLSFGDNDKAIFGAGSDLQIYHDGSHSIIQDSGTGDLILQGGNDLILRETDGTTEYLRANEGAGVEVFHNGSRKLLTTSAGIDVTGTVTADGLTVDGGATNFGVIVTSTDQYAGIAFADNTTTTNAHVAVYADGNHLGFEAGNAERMRIDSSGRVGIGTTSLSRDLTVAASVGGLGLGLVGRSSDDRAYTIYYENDGTTGVGSIYTIPSSNTFNINAYSGNSLSFNVDGSERMRIDSSGNVLVGTTNTDPAGNNVAGIALRSSGAALISRDGARAADFNRKTSDGDIVAFKKNGTTVGSIGVDYSSRLYIGTGDTGLFFNDLSNAVQPISPAGDLRGNAIDLGTAGTTFKSLYLGGGVYLGGTGSANKLDDYEEGTWTPTLTSNGTPPTVTSYNNRVGKYTKVGDLLYVSCFIRAELSSAGTGTPRVSGFPYNTVSGIYQPVYTGLINMLNNGTDAQPYSISGNFVQFDGGTSYKTIGNNYLCFSAVFKI